MIKYSRRLSLMSNVRVSWFYLREEKAWNSLARLISE